MLVFAAADIPIHKLQNKVLRKVFTKYFKEDAANALPSTTTIRRKLQTLHGTQYEKLKSTFHDKKVAILAEDTTDDEQRYVLNIMLLE